LTLKTEQKDDFLHSLRHAVGGSSVRAFTTSLEQLQWHPNEDRTRWFLVLRVEDRNHELMKLLRACNSVANMYDQPRLYEGDGNGEFQRENQAASNGEEVSKKFHISIAWSLQKPSENGVGQDVDIGVASLKSVRTVSVPFNEVKVRIGQDVTLLPLDVKRRRSSGVLA
jgi:hypothetical protein